METKLDLALKNFSVNPIPNKFRRETILKGALKSAAKGAAAGGLTGKALLKSRTVDLQPLDALLIVGAPTVVSAGVGAFKSAKALNNAQRYLNTFGGVDNLSVDQIVQDVLLDVDKSVISNPEKINQYLPREENDKFKAQIEEVKKKYPLDESKRGTEDYDLAKSFRQFELDKIDNQKFRALLKYAKLSNTKKKLKGLDKEYYS